MKPEHRARLFEIAARRGDKGFSSVVAAAKLRKRALRTASSLSDKDAESLRASTAAIRATWR